MSASLVGSEMCIRDSPPCTAPIHASGLCRRRQVVSSGEGGVGRPVGSVSYTHLTLPTICSV
eukprot:4083278-Alexandrium_andersonii.AAC.1